MVTKKQQTQAKKGVWALILLGSLAYLMNFTFGIVEFLPDMIPIIGHIDETIAAIAFLGAIKYLFKIDIIKIVSEK